MDKELIRERVRLQDKFHQRLLKFRSFNRILKSTDFEIAYENAVYDDKCELNEILERAEPKELKSWISKLTQSELETLSYRELRRRAQMANVHRWSRLSKEELIDELQLRSGE